MARTRFSLQVDGLAELRKQLQRDLPEDASSILRQTVHGIAGRVRDELKRVIQKRSGAAAASIKAVRRRGEKHHPVSDVRGGTTAPYLLMLEFGTRRTRAQPFITPTVEQTRPGLPAIYREEFGEKLEKNAARRARQAARARA